MNYITSDSNTLIWLVFSIYTVSILFLIPSRDRSQSQVISTEATNDKALQFASGLVLRVVLIFPMLFLLKNVV